MDEALAIEDGGSFFAGVDAFVFGTGESAGAGNSYDGSDAAGAEVFARLSCPKPSRSIAGTDDPLAGLVV